MVQHWWHLVEVRALLLPGPMDSFLAIARQSPWGYRPVGSSSLRACEFMSLPVGESMYKFIDFEGC